MQSTDVSVSTFIASGGIPSGPGAFPFFNCRIAFRIPCFGGLSVLMRSGVSAGGISGGSPGESRFNRSSKLSFHQLSYPAWVVNTCLVLSITYCSSLRRVPAGFRVMSYNSLRCCCPAASSAWLPVSPQSFFSRFILLFTSLLASSHRRCASVLAALVLLFFIAAFLCFLSATFPKVSAEIKSLCCIVLLPNILSHVSFHADLFCCHTCSTVASSSMRLDRSICLLVPTGSCTWLLCLSTV